MVCWLGGLLVGLLGGWFVWLVCWLGGWLVGSLVGRFVGCIVDQLVDANANMLMGETHPLWGFHRNICHSLGFAWFTWLL